MEILHSKKLLDSQQQEKSPSSLKFVDVQEIRDGVILLRNGSLRSILAISSINFDLKSTDEQNAIIGQYQNFLNSVDFPLQLLITSRQLNIQPYLKLVEDQEARQVNDLLRAQTMEYRQFIENLTSVTNIMTKRFYMIVPYFPVESHKRGMFQMLTAMLSPQTVIVHKLELFNTYKNQLFQRVDHVTEGLRGTGVKIVPLGTEEVIELLYNAYNPNLFATNILSNIESLEMKV